MYNIWGFLLQTLSVSILAVLLLVLKRILEDKLSPRWQYGVWSVLFLRVLIPVHLLYYIVPKLPIWIETLKGIVEKNLDSNYTEVYEAISVKHVVPILHGTPESITDWLMVIYTIGVVASLMRYLISYAGLRTLLKKGNPADSVLQERLTKVCEKYDLKPCQAVVIDGIESAFVCGIFKPILVVPRDVEIDDMVLLHEMLHLKYKDGLQSALWCVLRSLHWCNPFLQYVFHRIENDMESLCDQRVLERLEGEKRREYGTILLSMANSKYARQPGTSSISNGGKNISRRIQAIVRFKKYPKGMALVSVCIILVLGYSGIVGTANSFSASEYMPKRTAELEQAMAIARTNRCTTVAGALDTYAKGLMLNNGIYIASASSLSKHQDMETQMYYNSTVEGWASYYLEGGKYLYQDEPYDSGNIKMEYGYHVLNLTEISEKEYEAYIVVYLSSYVDENGKEQLEETVSGTVLIPVTIIYEDAWVVEEIGERTFYPYNLLNAEYEESFPIYKSYSAKSEKGVVSAVRHMIYTVENDIYNSSFFGSYTSFDESPKVNAEFEQIKNYVIVTYDYNENYPKKPEEMLGIIISELYSKDEVPSFPDIVPKVNEAGSSTDGYSWSGKNISDSEDIYIMDSIWSTRLNDEMKKIPETYAVKIFWDGEAVDEFILEEVAE